MMWMRDGAFTAAMTRHLQQSLGADSSDASRYHDSDYPSDTFQTFELDVEAGTQSPSSVRRSPACTGSSVFPGIPLLGPGSISDILMSCRRVGSDILRDPSAQHEESHVGGTILLMRRRFSSTRCGRSHYWPSELSPSTITLW